MRVLSSGGLGSSGGARVDPWRDRQHWPSHHYTVGPHPSGSSLVTASNDRVQPRRGAGLRSERGPVASGGGGSHGPSAGQRGWRRSRWRRSSWPRGHGERERNSGRVVRAARRRPTHHGGRQHGPGVGYGPGAPDGSGLSGTKKPEGSPERDVGSGSPKDPASLKSHGTPDLVERPLDRTGVPLFARPRFRPAPGPPHAAAGYRHGSSG